jgi:glycosyltransferase involved in cell wall biosynthesis
MRILMLPGSRTSPAARFRMWQYVEPIRRLGHKVDLRVISPDRDWMPGPGRLKPLMQRVGAVSHMLSAMAATRDADEFDVVFMNRDVVPEPSIEFVDRRLARTSRRIVFDFDDAIHLGRRAEKLSRLLPMVTHVTPGNEYLANFARQFNENVSIIPTVVDTEHYQTVDQREPGRLRLGWSGSTSTLRVCLPILKPVITRLARNLDFEFVVIADQAPDEMWAGVDMRFVRWTPADEVKNLQLFDVGLMPLSDSEFERGKCGLKAIQYMGVGVPALVSPVGVNEKIVIDGMTGFHCASEADWVDHVMLLAKDEELRRRMGLAGRKRVEASYSVHATLPRLLSIFESGRDADV